MRVHEIGNDGSLFTVLKAGAENFFVPVIPSAAQQALTDAGAVNVTSFLTAITTTTASAITLAAGTVKGQLKRITMVVDAGDATLTIANPVSEATDVVVFSAIGDTVDLLWTGTAWAVISRYNVATAAPGTPTIA